jgi:hypothetical protein
MSQAHFIRGLWVILCLLSLVDYAATSLMVKVQGTAVEFNGMMRWVMDHYGMPGVGVIKAAGLLVLGLMVWNIHPRTYRTMEVSLWVAVIIYSLNMAWTCLAFQGA